MIREECKRDSCWNCWEEECIGRENSDERVLEGMKYIKFQKGLNRRGEKIFWCRG